MLDEGRPHTPAASAQGAWMRALRAPLGGPREPRIYIPNFSGLGNRLEALVLAHIIAGRHGHTIWLDWPERDSLEIAGTRRGALPLRWRLARRKVRDFDLAGLEALAGVRLIDLRGTYAPRELQARHVGGVAQSLRLTPPFARALRDALAPYAGRPVVGVHLRQGDFSVATGDYDVAASRHPAPGLWWYAHAMAAYATHWPGTAFLVGYSGERTALESLRRNFDVITLPKVRDYKALLPGHASAGHPTMDLFGLACCTTLIATPTSSFSHWAGNLLGPETTVLLPPPRVARSDPALACGCLHGGVLLDWREAAETGRGMARLADGQPPPPPAPPQTGWLA